MNLAIKNKLIVGLLLLQIYSCKKFVEINPPTTELVTTSVFNNSSAATSAQTVIYTQMCQNNESYNISFENGLLGDELMNYNLSSYQVAFYHDNLSTAIGATGCWSDAYNYIYQANANLAALQNNSNVATSIDNQLMGESKFIRAFWHFYLVNEYGDVPLVTSANYTVNASAKRTPKNQVYQQIVSDLIDAEGLLNPNYVDASDTTVTSARVRPNQATAEALLARVYLYLGKYDSAKIEASAVINNPLYSLITPLTTTNYVFDTTNNFEAIWQLATPLPANYNGATFDGSEYILTTAPTNVSLSDSLVNDFEPGDQRKNVWVGTYVTSTIPAVTYYYPQKYQVSSLNGNPSDITEYVMVLRLAEQYLIRAEAEANLGDSTGAILDLNAIRNRANLPNYSLSNNGPLLAGILHERRVELFTEWGHRWFDLIRTNNLNSVMGNPGNVCQEKGGTWNNTSALYPIPLSDLSTDPNLSQNPGY